MVVGGVCQLHDDIHDGRAEERFVTPVGIGCGQRRDPPALAVPVSGAAAVGNAAR